MPREVFFGYKKRSFCQSRVEFHKLSLLLSIALLFYRNLVKDIETYGFQINPYDPCVANKMINKKQMTVVWHMDDLKVSHVDSFEVTNFEGYMSSIYGGLTGHKGKVN